MTGEVAPLQSIVKLKDEFDCMLYVDEAHSFGLYGSTGMGLCQELNILGDVDFIMASFATPPTRPLTWITPPTVSSSSATSTSSPWRPSCERWAQVRGCACNA